jgi:hypothetical protein
MEQKSNPNNQIPNFKYSLLEFIWLLACLREAPPPEALRRAGASAKAGAWCLEFERYGFPRIYS